jgi:hypothetical protein
VGPALSSGLKPFVPSSAIAAIKQAAPQYIDDAAEILLRECAPDVVVVATLEWLRSNTVAGYHGTRLTDLELSAMLAEGLMPLEAGRRKARLARVLSKHPEWSQLTKLLDLETERFGAKSAGGVREKQAHLTLSRAGLRHSFNHYLHYGSEFDQCVARSLCGDDALLLLGMDGRARIIEFAVPGRDALAAAHPFCQATGKMDPLTPLTLTPC